MITGRLPFPDAKGPAGLITAQLKQTPMPPSQANPKASLPPAADRVILKCLEKDKNNRYADVTALSRRAAGGARLAHEPPSMSRQQHDISRAARIDATCWRRAAAPGDMSRRPAGDAMPIAPTAGR